MTFNIITTSLIVIFRGFVFSKLWAWFVVSKFGLNSLSIPEAIGISILITLLTYQISFSDIEIIKNDTGKADFYILKFLSVFMLTSFLICGWILKFFL